MKKKKRSSSGRWKVKRGGLAPYHVVSQENGAILPASKRFALLRAALREKKEKGREAVVSAIRHLNAIRNYSANKMSERARAVRAAMASDIAYLKSLID